MPTHDAFVLLGALVATALLAWEARRRGRLDRPLAFVAARGLLGGAIGARLGNVVRHLASTAHPSVLETLFQSGKTVVGGLAGAYAGVLGSPPPLVVVWMSSLGLLAYWRAYRAGLTRSRCYLRDVRLVLLYLGVAWLVGAVFTVRAVVGLLTG